MATSSLQQHCLIASIGIRHSSSLMMLHLSRSLVRHLLPRRTYRHLSVRKRKEITISIPHHDKEFPLQWRQGQSFMQLAQDDDVLCDYIEASCGGTMACCSCHVYLDPGSFEALGESSVEERDMLDLVYEWKETSRLGCQVHLTDSLMDLDEVVVTIPAGVNNVW